MAKQKQHSSALPTGEQVAKYDMLSKLFESVFAEVKTLSAKKPDEALNKFKVGAVNRILKDVKEMLSTQPTVGFLDLLDEDSIPSNSDAVLILSQYDAALDHFRESHYKWDGLENRWSTQERPS